MINEIQAWATLLAILLATLAPLGAVIFKHFEARMPAGTLAFLKEAATIAVNSVEQLSGTPGGMGAVSLGNRQQAAIAAIKQILDDHHMPVPSDATLKTLIEGAVYLLPTTGVMGHTTTPAATVNTTYSIAPASTNTAASAVSVTSGATPATTAGSAV